MSNQNKVIPVEILLVEDNPGDVRLTQEALKESKVFNRLEVVEDGAEAMQYLHKSGKYVKSQRPDLILLDLNLPKKDGREVLADIKSDENLKRIPVVILTSSQAEDDIARTYNLHANCYISKPINLDKFVKIIRAIDEFWLGIVTLPPDGKK
jgi:two-component system, chemotaxis family, response regulator Rcp1